MVSKIYQEIYLLSPKYVSQVFGGPIIKIVLEMSLNDIYIAREIHLFNFKSTVRSLFSTYRRPILVKFNTVIGCRGKLWPAKAGPEDGSLLQC